MSTEVDPISEIDDEEEEVMPTFEHGVICSNLNYQLRKFLDGKNLGRVVDSSAEYRFLTKETEDKRKSGRQPDISFVQQERLPARFRSYPDIVPDLAIEVESPNDKPYELEAKIGEYQRAGVGLVWIIHPFSRVVNVYRTASGLKPNPFVEGEELSGEDVIPGFRLPVSAIFDFPPDPNPEPEVRKSSKN